MAEIRMSRIEKKIDKLSEGQARQEERLDNYNSLLKEHIKRTAILEIKHEQNDIKWAKYEAVLKFIGSITAIAGVAKGAMWLLDLLK